ncbi:MAG TPA: LD-carboxypeptidase [Pedobacter sp.]|uniref:S66 peptidase family protein n=1 Tax=Pedobacter sp. TaxID=1411316 RepID=UPI002D138F99|nr:LD-carboxypeptidase [Pedobacter sp.]HMI02513.1 LD-carboxypeptidase [Pedobacter sp.]
MIQQPAYLKKGDKIAIVCPASKLPQSIDGAIAIFKSWGLEVETGQTVSAEHHQFAGDDALRTQDLQHYLDDPDIKAIIAGRGGYGTIRIIDELDFTAFAANPKWIVGFSDITVLLSHIFASFGIQSIHAQMPYTFDEAMPESLESLRKALFGEKIEYNYKAITQSKDRSPSALVANRLGQASGILIGGNLTLLVMVEGSQSEMDYTDKILFIEDVGEREVSIDRMMRMLKRSGKLAKLKGLIVGAFNEIKEEKIPFGQSPEEIIWEIVKEYDYPVCFNFPVGHIEDNRAMVVGSEVTLSITNDGINIKSLHHK